MLLFSYFFSPHGLKNAQILMNVVFFVLSKIEISTRGTFISILSKYHDHENISYANLICINVLKILIKKELQKIK